jgi:hypothetical protein
MVNRDNVTWWSPAALLIRVKIRPLFFVRPCPAPKPQNNLGSQINAAKRRRLRLPVRKHLGLRPTLFVVEQPHALRVFLLFD